MFSETVPLAFFWGPLWPTLLGRGRHQGCESAVCSCPSSASPAVSYFYWYFLYHDPFAFTSLHLGVYSVLSQVLAFSRGVLQSQESCLPCLGVSHGLELQSGIKILFYRTFEGVVKLLKISIVGTQILAFHWVCSFQRAKHRPSFPLWPPESQGQSCAQFGVLWQPYSPSFRCIMLTPKPIIPQSCQ